MQPREPGLQAVNQARLVRRRALVLGKVRIQGTATRFWHWGLLLLACFSAFYYWQSQRQLTSLKAGVMAHQRSVEAQLGADIVGFRDQVESWTQELARSEVRRFIAPSLVLSEVTRGPGAYLRLRQEEASSVEGIRENAARSLHDGFTSCFFPRAAHLDAADAKPCLSMAGCEPGQICNEWRVCSVPSQPFNIRLLYRALRVLSADWSAELHEAPNDLAVRVFQRDLEQVARNDVPIAADVVRRSKYFTLIVDEDPVGGVPARDPDVKEETPETEAERLWRTPHEARIAIWELQTRKLLLQLRASAHASFVPMGEQAVADEAVKRAQQRQVNSCALAAAVREAIAPSGRTELAPGLP